MDSRCALSSSWDTIQSASRVKITISSFAYSENTQTSLRDKLKIQKSLKAPNLGLLTPAAVTTWLITVLSSLSIPNYFQGEFKWETKLPPRSPVRTISMASTKFEFTRTFFCVLDLRYQLLSVLTTYKLKLEKRFKQSSCRIKTDTKTIASGRLRNGIYLLDLVELSKRLFSQWWFRFSVVMNSLRTYINK